MKKFFVFFVLVAATSAFAQSGYDLSKRLTLEFGGAMGVSTLGTTEQRVAYSAGLEYAVPGRFFAIRGWNNIVSQDTIALRAISADGYGDGVIGYDAFQFSLGGRWIFSSGDLNPFMEFGTGIVIANRDGFDLSSRFNFGTFFGVGFIDRTLTNSPRFGLRFIHISNAGITPPNAGVNMLFLTVGFRF